jgi:predicted nucleic acid-binding protein
MPEIISALNRRIRERLFTQALYARVKRRLLHDVFDADVINLTPAVVGSAIRILEESPVRAMDALHIASALEWGAELFASADAQQLRAARRGGLDTIGV